MPHEEPTNFLYPFIDAQEEDPQSLLADLAASAQAKAAESLALRRTTLEANTELIGTAAAEMARRFSAGGRLFTFGNGGSCTDCTTLDGSTVAPATMVCPNNCPPKTTPPVPATKLRARNRPSPVSSSSSTSTRSDSAAMAAIFAQPSPSARTGRR